MKKRLLAVFLALALCAGLAPVQAFATSIDDNSVFLKQSTNYTCTLAAAAMMLRRHAILDGNSSWNTITESSVRADAWTENVGLKYSFSHRGMNVATVSLNGSGYITVSDKTNYLISMLTVHPEGIVIYNGSHAILLTDYNSSTGTFYCADPAGPLNGRITLALSTLSGIGQDAKIEKLTQVWYVSSGTAIGTGNPGGTSTAGRTSVPSVSVNGQSVSVSWSSNTVASSYDVYLIQDPWSWESIRYHISTQSQSCTFDNVAEGTYCAFTIARPNDDYTQSEWSPEFVVERSHDTHTWDNGVVTQEATLIRDGIKTFTCTVCGITRTEDISARISYTVSYGTTEIKDSEFGYCKNLTGITIPNSVTKIGKLAFYGCFNLTTVVIPNSVIEIENHAFFGCTNLSSVVIPNSVITIGTGAFKSCKSLTNVIIPDSVTKIEEDTFYGCTNLSSVFIPNSVTDIGNSAFVGCTSLTSVTIPDSVTDIGNSAFVGCTSLTSVTIPDSVTTIMYYTFSDCTNLTSITIPDSVTKINPYAFQGSINLKDVYYGGSKAQWKAIEIGDGNAPLGNATIHFTECTTHTYDSGTVAKAPTCVAEGEMTYTCTACGETKTEAIPVVEHTFDEGVVTRSPTITAEGEMTYTCTVCGETKTEAIPRLNDPREKFTDLSPTGFYLDAVAWALDKNVTTGTTATTFAPKDNCTHGQILTFLWRAAGSPASNATLPFETTGKEYYLGAAKWAYEKGMIDKSFDHKTPCTRAYAVLYIWQAFGQPAATKASPFTDIPAHWSSARAAAWASEKGVTTGTTATTFDPNRVCNRGEIVTFLYRAYKK